MAQVARHGDDNIKITMLLTRYGSKTVKHT